MSILILCAVGTAAVPRKITYNTDFKIVRLEDFGGGIGATGAANYTGATLNAAYVDTAVEITRGFFPFDTNGIPVDNIVTAVTFNFYVTAKDDDDNDGNDYIGIVQTTQASHLDLIAGDFDQCGTIDNPTQGATAIDIGNITLSAYNTWTFNATGLTWIKKNGQASSCGTGVGQTCLGLREGHDIVDSPYNGGANGNRIGGRFSETADITSDPYLTIEYTTAVVVYQETGSQTQGGWWQ